MSIKGTSTEKNLLKAFAGESQARNRYTFFAKQAKKEGFVRISKVFEETADHEMAHAKRFFKFLEGGDVEITASYPAGMIGTTLENLHAAAAGEHHEWTTLYPEFAKTARAEGFQAVAVQFEQTCVAEKYHEERYNHFIEQLEKGNHFRKDEQIKWRCIHCGYIFEGKAPPQKCPACGHGTEYFEALNDKL